MNDRELYIYRRHLRACQYFGPGGIGELRGDPKVVASNDRSRDVAVQKRLWAVSEELTGVVYPMA